MTHEGSNGAADEHVDVVIVGAGLSGIGAAYHLQSRLPQKTFAILESRDAIGGTWDLFRYPGIRSDSDMFTLGYDFRPWQGENAIADGDSIRTYIRETAATYGIDRHIRFGHTVRRAAWSSADAAWQLDIAEGDGIKRVSCGFLFVCAGYYDYARGYMPDFPGVERFRGPVIHPQAWPDDLDCAGKTIVVIGSGATAMTLVPELAARGAHVTLLQRSPSYVVSLPRKDRFARRMRRLLPATLAYRLVRWRNILISRIFYAYARRRPIETRARILAPIERKLGHRLDVRTHFNPRYKPWDQRMCLVPDGDLFAALENGSAEIVTDEIATFTADGIELVSGRRLPANIIVSATGLRLKVNGGIAISVDGAAVDTANVMSYKGAMFSDVPNLAYTLGYTNASWTLKCDLTSAWVCRLLAYMERKKYAVAVARRDPSVTPAPLIDFTSGYVQRAVDRLPKQGNRRPWRLNQNYYTDMIALRFSKIADGALRFTSKEQVRSRRANRVPVL